MSTTQYLITVKLDPGKAPKQSEAATEIFTAIESKLKDLNAIAKKHSPALLQLKVQKKEGPGPFRPNQPTRH